MGVARPSSPETSAIPTLPSLGAQSQRPLTGDSRASFFQEHYPPASEFFAPVASSEQCLATAYQSPTGVPRIIPYYPYPGSYFQQPYPVNAATPRQQPSSLPSLKQEMAHRVRAKAAHSQKETACSGKSSASVSAKDSVRRNLQQRIRMRMISKGKMPPNPTMEELQMCGIQPIVCNVAPTFPTRPAAQAGSLPPSLASYAPYSYGLPLVSIPYAYTSPTTNSPVMQPIPYGSPCHGFVKNHFLPVPRGSQEPGHSPHISYSPIEEHDRIIYAGDPYYEQDSHRDHNIVPCEPFILPDREAPPCTYESYFGDDYTIEQRLH